MSIQVLPTIPIHKERTGIVVPFSESRGKRRKDSKIAGFINRLNPASWFNEFKDIRITMEEFDSKKK